MKSLIKIVFSIGVSTICFSAMADDQYVLVLTHGFSNHQLTVSYYPVAMPLENCRTTLLAEISSFAATAHNASHFRGGEILKESPDRIVWRSDRFGGAPFRAVGECRKAIR